jgi:hypothetical protein
MISLFIFVQKGIRLIVGYKDLNEDYNVMQVVWDNVSNNWRHNVLKLTLNRCYMEKCLH